MSGMQRYGRSHKVTQPVQPGLKIYPARCEKCGGKGRITLAVN
jgi:hypothetical protein